MEVYGLTSVQIIKWSPACARTDTLRRGAGAGAARARRAARPGATRAAEPRRAAEDTADIAPRGVAHVCEFCK